MTKINTITIDSQAYDALTGLPVKTSPAPSSDSHPISLNKTSHHVTPSRKLHGGPQRSITLKRKIVKKPVPLKHQIVNHASRKHMDITRPALTVHRSRAIKKFAPHPVGALTSKEPEIAPAIIHPHVAKAHAKSAAAASTPLSAKGTKDNVIRNAIANTHKKSPATRKFGMRQRTLSIVGATFALVLLTGYFTYVNMPSISVRVAAAQAGIDASYPEYRPDGYALNGPVTYSDGKVSMNFKANGGDQAFTVNQTKSGWDNEALLDKLIAPKAGSNYVPYTERGLTIYTYGDNAAWVNNGILYTIEGDAPLSSNQMRHIATSLL